MQGRVMYVLAVGCATASASPQFVNGSLDGTPGWPMVPPGWRHYNPIWSTAAVVDSMGPFGTYNLSPDGGTAVRVTAWGPDLPQFVQRGGIVQTVDGFEIGQQYAVTFYQSGVNGINSITGEPFAGAPGLIELVLNDELVGASNTVDPPAGFSLDNSWTNEEITFIADSQTIRFAFRAAYPATAPGDTRTALLIDGLSLRVVPSPSSAMAVAAFGLYGVVRRRRIPPAL